MFAVAGIAPRQPRDVGVDRGGQEQVRALVPLAIGAQLALAHADAERVDGGARERGSFVDREQRAGRISDGRRKF
jgi:hypothetical protein